MMLKKIGYGLTLIAAGAVGYFLHPTAEVKPEAPKKVSEKRRADYIPDRGEFAKMQSLRRKVRDLEAQLAQSRVDADEAISNAVAKVAQSPRRDFPRGPGWRRLEELKQRDPQRYAQVTNRMAKMRVERKNRQAARVAFLASVSSSGMSAADKKTHDDYQELLAKREELEEQMHQPEISDEARHELMKEMRELDQQMRTLGASERNLLLGEMAKSLGAEGEEAEALVQTVNEVVDATTSEGRFPPSPPPGGGRP